MSSIVPRIRNLSAMSAVIRVAEHGSFTAGSKALGLSPSAASKTIARLEEELGVKLFHRTTRSVGLTAEGQQFVEAARPLLEDLEAVTAQVIDSTSTPRGLLRITAPETFGRTIVAPMLSRYRDRYPDVTVDLLLEDKHVDLAQARIDVAIRTGSLTGQTNLIAKRLLVDPLIVCAAPSYLAATGMPVSADCLSEHVCLSYRNAETGAPVRWQLLNREPQAYASAVTVNDISAVARLAADGAGIAQLPGYLARPLLSGGHLTEVLRKLRPAGVPYSAVYLDRRFLSPRVRTFMDFIAESLQSGAVEPRQSDEAPTASRPA